MEGGEAGGAQWDGGIHHTQQECHYWTHLPRGGAHGEFFFFIFIYTFDQFQDGARNKHILFFLSLLELNINLSY